MKRLTVETCKTSDTLLELAAKNDIDGFTKLLNRDSISVDQVGLWYVCQKGSKQVVRDKRTPLMVASMYGSLDVLRKILSLSRRDINRSTGDDKTTAIHCAASCGSLNAVEAVKLLFAKGADPSLMDANCLRPVDMIVDSPEYPDLKHALHEILGLKDGILPMKLNFETKREYHVDPSLPKIKNFTYLDEFMMCLFKVIPCSHALSHNWEECPFFHPGESARRRDPRKYLYSSVPCPEFKKGTCRRGDLCGYAHGIFECWMHPAKYRTRFCDWGTDCNRYACFFAHNEEELRHVKSPSLSGNGMLNWQVLPESYFHARLFPDQSMFSPRNNLSVFNQFQSMSPQSFEAISPMRARGLNLAPDYQHGQPQVRSLSLQELGSTSVDPWSRWASFSREPDLVVNKKEPDLSWIQSSSLSDQSSFRNNWSTLNQSQQQQNMSSPFNMNFSPKNAPSGIQSMSSRSVEAISPMSGTRFLKMDHENQHPQELRRLSSSVFGSNSVDPWSERGSSSGRPDWAVNNAKPNFPWVLSLVNETPHEVKEGAVYDGTGPNLKNELEKLDEAALLASIEQMQLDCIEDEPNCIGRQYRNHMPRQMEMEMEKKSND